MLFLSLFKKYSIFFEKITPGLSGIAGGNSTFAASGCQI
jgi:4-diphosphocytidyl-2C-methyl-D-erythritol kinase